MKERPIIFGGPMVNAIHDGIKTQTRCVVKCKKRDYVGDGCCEIPCPYGTLGDRLWVRETWQHMYPNEITMPLYKSVRQCFYRSDETDPESRPVSGRWRSPIFMPRWASRITLEITSIRCERLIDISESDAIAEGVASREEYANLWETIHGPGSWSANPFVWVIRFSVIEAGATDGQ